MPPMPWKPGARVGQYELIERIGQGGMGAVYKAIQPSLNKTVAIKVLPDAAAADAQLVARFRREAAAIAALSHPNIVDIYDFGEYEGAPYFVMKFVTGGTLRERLSGPIDPAYAATILVQIAS